MILSSGSGCSRADNIIGINRYHSFYSRNVTKKRGWGATSQLIHFKTGTKFSSSFFHSRTCDSDLVKLFKPMTFRFEN